MKKILFSLFVIVLIMSLSLCLIACNDDDDHVDTLNIATGDLEGQTLRFAAPQGTPALAIAKLIIDNQMIDGATINYAVVDPSTIAAELTKSDLVIMPVNAGATKIVKSDADFKLVSVAVEGSLYIIGQKEGSNVINFNDLKGKTLACIGQGGVPDLVLKHLLSKNGIEYITEGNPSSTQVKIKYVSQAAMARTALQNKEAQFALVGEPAVTQFKAALSLNAELDIQKAYEDVNKGEDFPQAGLFVKTSLANNASFMRKLFIALDNSEDWVEANKESVQSSLVNSGRYDTAVFPAASIDRCNIDAEELDEEDKEEIINFLKNVAPSIDWANNKTKLFG